MTDTLDGVSNDVIELIGVYDADSTLIGEVSYWLGARLGRTHCSLCELTHGLFAVKREWKDCSRALAIPFRTFHRNDAPPEVRDVAAGDFPCVIAVSPRGLRVVLDRVQLGEFAGSTTRFASWLAEFGAGVPE